MIMITAIGGAEKAASSALSAPCSCGAGLLVVVAAIGRWIAPRANALFATQAELLVLAAVTYAVTLATITEMLGFSGEVGAFLAGMSLASTPHREALSGRLSTLCVFLLVFFIELGTTFDLSATLDQIPSALAFSMFVLVGNPLIVLVIMRLLGDRKESPSRRA